MVMPGLDDLREIAEFERDQLRQTLEFLGALNAAVNKQQQAMMDFELKWLGLDDKDKPD